MKRGKSNIVGIMTLAGVLTALPLGAANGQQESILSEKSTQQKSAQEEVAHKKVAAVTEQAKLTFNEGVKQGKLETALMFSEHLSPFKIESDVSGDRATLKGEVSQEVEKELAGVIAKGVEGIEKVDNQLVVDSAAQRRDPETEQGLRGWVLDAGITAEVKAEFLTSREIDGLSIDVTTERGVVTLEGEVESKVAKDLAEQIALTAQNVNGVKNRLRVRNS